MARQNKEYSDQIDIWYARDVYRVGRAFLGFWLLMGFSALAVFGVLVLSYGLQAGWEARGLPASFAKALLGWGAVALMAGALLYGLTDRVRLRYWALAGLGIGGPLWLVASCWHVAF